MELTTKQTAMISTLWGSINMIDDLRAVKFRADRWYCCCCCYL